jgi:hypothetical protein
MEASGMARRSKQEYLAVMWDRYQRADRVTRSALLDEVTRMCGYHRKYAIGLLTCRQPPGFAPGASHTGARPTVPRPSACWPGSGSSRASCVRRG